MSEDVVRGMFESLGLPILSDTLERGDLCTVVDDDELTAYTAVCLYRLSRSDPDDDVMFNLYVRRLAAVLSGDENEGYIEVNGEPAIVTDNGPIDVTPGHLRHWQWMAAIFGNREVARAFVEAVPPSIKEAAEQNTNDAMRAQFDAITSSFDGDDQ